MSFVQQIKLHEVVKKQFSFKLKAYHNLIGSLIIFQLIGLAVSLVGEISSVMIKHLMITTKIYSGNMIITLTWLWAFIISLNITNRNAKNIMFTFVSNKLSNHLANFMFMLFISVLGSVTAVLLFITARFIMILYLGLDTVHILSDISMVDVGIAIFATFLYHLLIFSLGYIIGEAIRLHKSFIWFIPLLLLTLFVLSVNIFGDVYILSFYFLESNLFFFTLKVVSTMIVIWFVAIVIGRGSEVRR